MVRIIFGSLAIVLCAGSFIEPALADTTALTTVQIDGGAASGVSGTLQLNASSGTANSASNTIAIGVPVSVGIADLAITRPATVQPATPPGQASHTVVVSGGAFTGTSGVVQLNAIAGSQNSARNDISLSTASH